MSRVIWVVGFLVFVLSPQVQAGCITPMRKLSTKIRTPLMTKPVLPWERSGQKPSDLQKMLSNVKEASWQYMQEGHYPQALRRLTRFSVFFLEHFSGDLGQRLSPAEARCLVGDLGGFGVTEWMLHLITQRSQELTGSTIVLLTGGGREPLVPFAEDRARELSERVNPLSLPEMP